MVPDNDEELVHRELRTDQDNPSAEIAEIVAELKGTEMEQLPTAYEVLNDILSHLFQNPPASEAQAQITFSYDEFRITVEQNGEAKFVQVS